MSKAKPAKLTPLPRKEKENNIKTTKKQHSQFVRCELYLCEKVLIKLYHLQSGSKIISTLSKSIKRFGMSLAVI